MAAVACYTVPDDLTFEEASEIFDKLLAGMNPGLEVTIVEITEFDEKGNIIG